LDGRNSPDSGRPWRDNYPWLLDVIRESEQLGADSVWLTEHHLFDDGYLPQPLVLAAAIAARTERIRIGTSVVLAPMRHPAHLAEETAVVDLVSGGRFDLGIGAGYVTPDFGLFGVPMESRFKATYEVFHEVRRLLDEDGVTPAPLQRPFPIWLGFHGPVGARNAGRLGAGLLTLRRSQVQAYLEGWASAGRSPADAHTAGAVDIFVADDPEAAYERIKPHWLYQVNTYMDAAHRPHVSEVDLGDRLGNGRGRVLINLHVLTPDEAVAEVRRRTEGLPVIDIHTWGTIAGTPEDLAGRHRELWFGPVRDALIQP
jgi:alkanesulfonate monooxygenase SsuD/methylene tetrahydromethanopterin reductase-like flavin-dependent oxidoreductase (luciferase family)